MQHRKLTDIIAPNARNILFCFFLSLLLWYDIFVPQATAIFGTSIDIQGKSPLSVILENFLHPDSFQGKVIGLLLYLFLCFMLTRLNEVFSFIRVRTILPALFCIIIGGLLLRPHLFSTGIIVSLLIVFAVFSAFRLLSEANPRYAFNAGLFFFTAALFSFSCIWFLPIFWLFLYSGNVFSLRIFTASLLGALTPVLYAVIGFVWLGDVHSLLLYVQENARLFAVDFHFSLPEIIYLGLIAALALVSLIHFMLVHSRENIKPRQESAYISIMFVSTLVLIILSVPDSAALFGLLIVFGSLLIGRFFSLVNNLFTRIILFLFFTVSLLLFLYHIFI